MASKEQADELTGMCSRQKRYFRKIRLRKDTWLWQRVASYASHLSYAV